MPGSPARIQPPRFETPIPTNPRKAPLMTVRDLRDVQPPMRMKLSGSRPDVDAVLRPHFINARSALMNALSVTREELDRHSGQKVIGETLTSITQEIAILSGLLHEMAATGDQNTP